MLLALMPAAGALGLLGPGPLGRIPTGDGALTVEYDRLPRWHSSAGLRIVLPAAEGGLALLWIDPAYLNSIGLEATIPEPVRAEVREPWIVFLFRTDPVGRAAVTARVRPRRIGPLTC